jgi:hypothetical protein
MLRKKQNLRVTGCYLQGDEITSDKYAMQFGSVKGRELGKRRCRQEGTRNIKTGSKNSARKGANGLNWLRLVSYLFTECYLRGDEITSDKYALQSDNVKGRELGKRRCRQEGTRNVKMGLKTVRVRVGMG